MAITINGSGTIAGISVGGLENGCINEADLATAAVTNTKLASNAVTIDKLGTTEQSQLCKAWVNFDGTSNSANLSGTYSQSGTTVTVTATAHGLIVGSSIYSDITSGTGVDGTYTVATVTDANTFTYTAGTSLTTSGNITLRRNTIRASYNVSSITDNGTGDYTVNFTTAMADTSYVPLITTHVRDNQTAANSPPGLRSAGDTNSPFASLATGSVNVIHRPFNANTDPDMIGVAIFR